MSSLVGGGGFRPPLANRGKCRCSNPPTAVSIRLQDTVIDRGAVTECWTGGLALVFVSVTWTVNE